MFAVLCALALPQQQPALKLHSLFSDNMVLQRDVQAPIFGRTSAGQEVVVEIAGNAVTTTADLTGYWKAKLPRMRAGGPYTLTVRGNGSAVARNVMVGEVWVASGQSNMEWPVSAASDPEREQANADTDIRMFTVQKVSLEQPASEVTGSWLPATKETVGSFSAVGYAFARELHKELNVPVGIIHTSWGGTPAESWTSRAALTADPDLRHMVDTYMAQLKDWPERKASFDAAMAEWTTGRRDGSNQGYMDGWAFRDIDTTDWKVTKVPTTVEAALDDPNVDGAVWFRLLFVLPDELYGQPLRLELGPIDDYDDTYINGNKIGSTKFDNENAYMTPRSYRVAPGVMRRGENLIAIRVFDGMGPGGFTGSPDQIRLVAPDGSYVPLAGDWLVRLERRLDRTKPAPQRPFGPGNPWAPGGLYNGMLAPLAPYAIKGAIWYQGESNAGRAYQYRKLFPLMIRDWRRLWGQGDFPFYFVQLANFMARKEEPGDSAWAELREAQAMTVERVPNTGVALAIDIGEANDIHPKNKREVGRRLALLALARDYGLRIPHNSPRYRQVQFSGNEARVYLDNVGEGLATADGGPVKGFAIAGEDRKFYWADAKISGTTVIVSSPQVARPVAVRYAWADNPEVNLTNKAGLPVIPFRTDDWPGVTQNAK